MTVDSFKNIISPFQEMIAYETLWRKNKSSFKVIAELFEKHKDLPSIVLDKETDLLVKELIREVESYLKDKTGFSVCIRGDFQYPKRLLDAKHPIELFYYKGDITLTESRCVSIVGARKVSELGLKRAERLTRLFVENEFTIVSGLAKGIDTAAHTTAIKNSGKTIGVIGTPIDEYYPKDNKELQNEIAKNHLLISQVPFYKYGHEPFRNKAHYFPERNKTMAALSEATIIVEASNTSGSLTQARACLQQERKLFILNSCFEKSDLTWPHYYEKKGAIRVRDFEDIIKHLEIKDEK